MDASSYAQIEMATAATSSVLSRLHRPQALHRQAQPQHLELAFQAQYCASLSFSLLSPTDVFSQFSSFVQQLNMYGFHKINRVDKLTAMQHRLPTHSIRRRRPRRSAACRTRDVRGSGNGPPALVDKTIAITKRKTASAPPGAVAAPHQSPLLAR